VFKTAVSLRYLRSLDFGNNNGICLAAEILQVVSSYENRIHSRIFAFLNQHLGKLTQILLVRETPDLSGRHNDESLNRISQDLVNLRYEKEPFAAPTSRESPESSESDVTSDERGPLFRQRRGTIAGIAFCASSGTSGIFFHERVGFSFCPSQFRVVRSRIKRRDQ
jgi:hypothetical protein